ncbi:hypothetical protein IC229_24830 [Spirosoma sp. BT702]|uniref:Uncharacterized protein n=1 Tax=Spirosoma profusum TaxID=2771354 RepID=A0A926XZK3_9BACT|nr:hypothetical protein [Spirosoma profusum]MBD2703894.1 hypothetical protein [Spirosoma profusum]
MLRSIPVWFGMSTDARFNGRACLWCFCLLVLICLSSYLRVQTICYVTISGSDNGNSGSLSP